MIPELGALGLTSREIGERLYLASSTVKTYMRRVYEKLGVQAHTAAVVEGIRRGVISEMALGAVDPSPPIHRAPVRNVGASRPLVTTPADVRMSKM